MTDTDEGLHGLEWLSEFLNVPERTIYAWRARGEGPPAYRVGKHLRYRRDEVETWLKGRHDTVGQRAAG